MTLIFALICNAFKLNQWRRAFLGVLSMALTLTSGLALGQVNGSLRFQKVALPPQEIVLLETSNGRCTGSLVSNQGHILTARHCLQKCLLISGVFQFSSAGAQMPSLLKVNPEKLGVAKCTVKVNGIEQEVIVESTSPGFISKIEERSFEMMDAELFQKLKNLGFTSQGDFAIIRLLKKNETSCLKISSEAVAVGDPVHTFSYPSQTFRPDQFNSNGESMYQTHGVRVSSIARNSCLNDLMVAPEKIEDLKESFDEPTAIISSVDSIYGSSGSSLLNAKREVVGILTNVFRLTSVTKLPEHEPENIYCAGSSKALDINKVREILQSNGQNLADFTRCQ